ncbi:glycogen debranching protein GlgX [Pararhizobium mangrovi]|uniref:Glycogen debranching protein GlgX n=1 Tax=Pararhizobium mangrovi TaxID=2590452 RepID=A0A506U6C9_9HYPH|nr:glycogen debranching protein GlgX [Pararhizobium mangrovi]TPW29923.1 glycogen debranching protein GlgX [Pararhizobium mangrovi]
MSFRVEPYGNTDTGVSDEPPRLGATLHDGGVTFAVHSGNADTIELVLFDETGGRETARHRLEREGDTHRVFVDGIVAGTRYGFRAHGPFDPANGLRFDPSKLLVDPYALAIDRPFAADPRLSVFGEETADLVPKAIVSAPPAVAPRTPRFEPGGFVYELSVRAFTMRHPDVVAEKRGTIAALAEPAIVRHLTELGVDAVELMPIAAWIDEAHLGPLGLTNAWGYQPVTNMALDPRLAPGGIHELRETVTVLHEAGIDVFLDVVFNHTGEGDEAGPTLSLRGFDAPLYYRHEASDPGALVNDTGCGNTLACDRAPVEALILDTMRHFVRHAGIDGFRFDLAPILGRNGRGFQKDAPIFDRMREDPLLADRIIIAEPWDIGPSGHQLGRFPSPFLEWNDGYRDTVRDFWNPDGSPPGAIAARLAGSADIFAAAAARSRTVNFIAAHDGFALADIVAYREKHNVANGEENRDGHDDNRSWNHGVEGPSEDPDVAAARASDRAALIATLFTSRGTIMLTAGDEFARTQNGNNNAYAQDNATTWLDWEDRDHALAALAAKWSDLRKRFPALADPRFLTGEAAGDGEPADVEWLHPEGRAMTVADWEAPQTAGLAMVLCCSEPEAEASRIAVLFNRSPHALRFELPAPSTGAWERLDETPLRSGSTMEVAGRSVALLAAMKPGARSGEYTA